MRGDHEPGGGHSLYEDFAHRPSGLVVALILHVALVALNPLYNVHAECGQSPDYNVFDDVALNLYYVYDECGQRGVLLMGQVRASKVAVTFDTHFVNTPLCPHCRF